MKICFATNNKHKLAEVARAVNEKFTIISLAELSVNEDLPETQNTFQGNALQKAQFIFERYHMPCFADDSGLVVEALNGSPGVFSARYAGPQRSDKDNIQLLLNNLKNQTNRKARFITVIALVGLGKNQLFQGEINGIIADQPRGNNGFGYDPIFLPEHATRTFAEMTLDEKNKLSHRAIAVAKLVEFLKNLPPSS
jgi:XTP/dITP diphosphohydrolase